jgi:hypothetical protein
MIVKYFFPTRREEDKFVGRLLRYQVFFTGYKIGRHYIIELDAKNDYKMRHYGLHVGIEFHN